jgi:hypothetical protein
MMLPASGSQQDTVLALREQVNAIFFDCLEACQQTGEFRFAEPGLLRVAITSLCVAVSLWFSPRGAIQREELGVKYSELVLRMVR